MGMSTVDLLVGTACAPGDYDQVSQRLRGYLRRHSIKEIARITGAQVRTVEGWFAGDALPGWRHLVPLARQFGRGFLLDVFAPLFDDDSFDRRLAELTEQMMTLQQDFADATRVEDFGPVGPGRDAGRGPGGRLRAAAVGLGAEVGRVAGALGRASAESVRAARTSVRGFAVGLMLAAVALQVASDGEMLRLWRAPFVKITRVATPRRDGGVA